MAATTTAATATPTVPVATTGSPLSRLGIRHVRVVLLVLGFILVTRQSQSFVTSSLSAALLHQGPLDVPSSTSSDNTAVGGGSAYLDQTTRRTEAEAEIEAEIEEAVEDSAKDEVVDTPQSTDSTSSSSAMLTIPTATKPSGCPAVLQRMHEWNDCWRRHVMAKKASKNGEAALHEDIRCFVSSADHQNDNSNSNSSDFPIQQEDIGAPLYQFAFYAGQGFGRFVAHTVEACALAFLLQRPCLVNMSPRDTHYTWRSFLTAPTYHWDPTLLHSSSPTITHQLDVLTQQLSALGADSWGDKTNKFNTSRYKSPASLVFPMETKFNKTEQGWKAALGYYSSPPIKQQVLLSPNWGNAWFTRIPLKDIFQDYFHCDYAQLTTQLQNAMYGPTDLALQLHETRITAARKSGQWNVTTSTDSTSDKKKAIKKARTKKAKEDPLTSRILPHTTSSSLLSASSSSTDKNYGTVHVRLHFLNAPAGKQRDTPIDKGDIVTMVRRCLKMANDMILQENNDSNNTSSSSSNIKELPQNWWLLADDAAMAVDMAGGMQRRQATQRRGDHPSNPLFDQKLPIVNWYHNYSAPPKVTKQMSSEHSMKLSARGLYGHANMAGSIEDWMALHQSQVVIVVHEGSFGVTGARGNGKLPRGYCGSGKFGPTNKNQNSFQIFF